MKLEKQKALKVYKLNSSVLSHACYDPKRKTLSLLFHSGKAYCYFGIPRALFQAFMRAKSKGSFYNTEIAGIYDSAPVEILARYAVKAPSLEELLKASLGMDREMIRAIKEIDRLAEIPANMLDPKLRTRTAREYGRS